MSKPRKRSRNPELEDLRARVLKEQRKSGAKIARNKREKGVDIFGTSQDPRANAAKIARYTAKQLLAHEAKLKEFNSRRTQFVPGVEGAPIPLHKWKQYQYHEEKHNAIGDERMAERGHLKAPGAGMTIADREESVRSKIHADGSVLNRPYGRMNRDSTQITDVDKLDKLIEDMKKKNSREFIPQNIAAQREQLNDMLKTIGNEKFIKQANELTDYQFDVLFNDTNFANTVSLRYYILQRQAKDIHMPSDAAQSQDAESDIRGFFKWAKTGIPEAPTPPGGSEAGAK